MTPTSFAGLLGETRPHPPKARRGTEVSPNYGVKPPAGQKRLGSRGVHTGGYFGGLFGAAKYEIYLFFINRLQITFHCIGELFGAQESDTP